MYATRRKNKKIATFLKLFVEFLAQYTDVYYICTVKQNKGIMRKPSKEFGNSRLSLFITFGSIEN